MSPAQYENVRVGSVQWLLDGDQQFSPDESEPPVQGEPVETVRRARRSPTRIALAALAVIVVGAGVVLALPEMTSRFSGSKPETPSVPPKTAPVAETGQPAAPAPNPQAVAAALPPPPPPAQAAVSQPLPQPPPAALPKTALPPLAAALPEPLHAAPPPPAQSAPAAAPISPVLPVASLAAPAVPAAPAAQAPAAPAPVVAAAVPKGAAAPVAEPFRVRLSFTAEQSKVGEAFARQLRQEGYTVTSAVIHATSGRWPGVAYFFRSDRDTARLIARQLTAITGRTEHARMSPRRPYPRPGTIEVSLLRYAKSGGTTGKRAHRLSLAHTRASHEEL